MCLKNTLRWLRLHQIQHHVCFVWNSASLSPPMEQKFARIICMSLHLMSELCVWFINEKLASFIELRLKSYELHIHGEKFLYHLCNIVWRMGEKIAMFIWVKVAVGEEKSNERDYEECLADGTEQKAGWKMSLRLSVVLCHNKSLV